MNKAVLLHLSLASVSTQVISQNLFYLSSDIMLQSFGPLISAESRSSNAPGTCVTGAGQSFVMLSCQNWLSSYVFDAPSFAS